MEKETAQGKAGHEGGDGFWKWGFRQKRHKEKRSEFWIRSKSRKELLDVRAIFKKWVVSTVT